MFKRKSIFLKYTSVFLAINIVCFAVILFTASLIVNMHLVDEETNNLEKCAESVGTFVDNVFDIYCLEDPDFDINSSDVSSDFFTDYLDSFVQFNSKVDSAHRIHGLEAVISPLARTNENMLVFITSENKDGKETVVWCDSENENAALLLGDYEGKTLPNNIAKVLSRNSSISGNDRMGKFFTEKTIYYAYSLRHAPTKGENPVHYGTVFCCISDKNSGADMLIMKIIRNVLITGMWIMLASLILIYSVTERMLSPIRAMHKAAKAFASGQFDARIQVSGKDEIAELSTAFNNMAQSLQELEDMRTSFLANISHDLRTPMTTITGFIDGILDGAIPPEQHEYYLGIIASETRRLSRLVSQLLDVSRLEAGERKLTPKVFDICEQGREIIISNIQRLEDKKLDVRFECERDNMYVLADSDATHQIFYNICDNAIKFAKEGGVYEINITEQNNLIYVSVYDEGADIPADDLPHIFDRFYKTDKSRGVDRTGVGLGMYIARTIIEAQGQKIWAESEPGWCRFTFTLPKALKNDKDRKRKNDTGVN